MVTLTSASRLILTLALVGPLALVHSAAQASPEDTPLVGDCTNGQTIDSWILTGEVVDCETPHTGQTIYVGEWTSTTSPDAANRMSDAQQAKVVKALGKQFTACKSAAESYLRSRKGSAVRVSVFTTNGTGPDAEQWAAGERWFRCDIVAKQSPDSWTAPSDRLLTIPSPDELRGYLATPDYDVKYEYCFAENPETKTYFPFDCSSPKVAGTGVAWTSPEGRYPGSIAAAFAQMRKQCQSTMAKLSVNVATSGVWALNHTRGLSKSNYRKSLWMCGVGYRALSSP